MKLIKSLAAAMLCGATFVTYADDSFRWDISTVEFIRQGDVKRGEELAQKNKCYKCHGENGISDEDDTPNLAGQKASYAYKQMMDYKNKVRLDKSMYKRMRKLNDQDMADLAKYYETKPALKSAGEAQGQAEPYLIANSDTDRFLLGCNVCHGKTGDGMGYEAPRLAGQKKEHFIEMMGAFKEGDRDNDHYGRMRFIAQQLTDEEVNQMAEYYAALPPAEE